MSKTAHRQTSANIILFLSTCSSQLNGWYNKDDVVAEWKKVKDELCLHVHCYVSGPNPLLDLAAEFRYHIFSKELPLVSLNSILFCTCNISFEVNKNAMYGYLLSNNYVLC